MMQWLGSLGVPSSERRQLSCGVQIQTDALSTAAPTGIELSSHCLLGGLRQKARSREPLSFRIAIDLIENVGWYRHVDAHAFDFRFRRIDENGNAVLVFGNCRSEERRGGKEGRT